MKGTIGLVVLQGQTGIPEINIYNKDGSVWNTISFKDDGQYQQPDGLSPFAFHKDYFVLALRCKARSDRYYTVVVNEEKGTEKYIKADDHDIRFETWEEHLLTLFSVGFNENDNPLMSAPEKGAQIPADKDTFYHPVKVEGDWLQVKWANEKCWYYGWIRWRKGDMLLIELFYIC